MINNIDQFLEWANEVDPRLFYRSEVFKQLEEFGFLVKFFDDRGCYCQISLGERSAIVAVNTWDDDFNALLNRGLPFFVIDESHEGEPEFHDGKRAGYSIVNPSQVNTMHLSMLGAGYIYKNEETMKETTVVGGSVIRALARIIANESPGDEFHGRGFAAQADLRAITNALAC